MDIKILKEKIKTNSIPGFMIFNVNEPLLAKQYITQISNTLNKYFRYYDNLKEVIYEITTNLKDDFLYIVLDYQVTPEDTNDIDYIINSNRNIILYYSDPGNFKINSKYSEYVIDFNNVDKNSMLGYALKILKDKNININQDKVEEIINYCNCNYSIFINELDKIITLGQQDSNVLVDYMLNNGFSDYRKINIFNFSNKILNRDKSVFDDAYRFKDSVVTLLSILYNCAKNRLIKYNNINYSNIMKTIIDIDSSIKDGSMDDSYALNYLLLKVM